MNSPPVYNLFTDPNVSTEVVRFIQELYQTVRNIRDGNTGENVLVQTWNTLKTNFPKDWLLPVEIVELLTKSKRHPELLAEIKTELKTRSGNNPERAKLIKDSLKLSTV